MRFAVPTALAMWAGMPAIAQEAPPPPEFVIGYLQLEHDPRQNATRVHDQIPVTPLGHAVQGAELAIVDTRPIGRVIGVEFELDAVRSDNLNNLLFALELWADAGIHFAIADLPSSEMNWLAGQAADLPVTIFNISATDDALRADGCHANLIHIVPSQRMLTDAIVQFLVAKRWERILVLQGPLEEDRKIVDAMRASVATIGGRIVDVRQFVPGDDPRNRPISNVAPLTAADNYDVVFVADSVGDFASTVPYRTDAARPVVGSAGMVAGAWHWSWQGTGATQLNARFEFASGRLMGSADWAAWVAVRAIVQSVLRAGSVEYDPVLDYLTSDTLNLDGAKISPLSVRPWDNQLRQPILLATHNSVVARAPLEGFVHPSNNLDTLGVAEAQSTCQL